MLFIMIYTFKEADVLLFFVFIHMLYRGTDMDKKITILTIILVFIGLISVYSSSHVWALYKYNDALYFDFGGLEYRRIFF